MIRISSIIDIVTSHALSLGVFDKVYSYMPETAPSNNLSAYVYVSSLMPINSSGLAATSARLELKIDILAPMVAGDLSPEDVNLIKAVDVLFEKYNGDFNLGSEAREIDLLGAEGQPLSADFEYVNISGAEFRVATITLPIIINDVWEQVA